MFFFFFFQAEDGIRDGRVTGVQTCALPILTSARPSAGRAAVPAKTTSSILPPRSGLTPCWPITQENASTTLDLPEPFGPTTQVIPGSKRSVVAEAKDLNPRKVRVFRYTRLFSSSPRPGSTAPYP